MQPLIKYLITCIGASSILLAETKGITPIAGPRVENGADVFITADFIFWEANQAGFPYVYSTPLMGTSAGKIHYPNFHFDPGFQVGLGLELGHDGWDTYVNYTWFHPQSREDTFLDNSNRIYEQAGLENSAWFYDQGKMVFDFKLDVIDFEIGRNYYVSEHLAIRPFMGLKFAWNREDAKQYFNDISNAYFIETTQKAFDAGMRLGLDSRFKINDNWSIYGNSAFSTLASNCKGHTQATETTAEPNLVLTNLKNKNVVIQPVLELSLGIAWDIWSDDQEYHLGVSAGYDFQYWNSNLYTVVPLIDPTVPTISNTLQKKGDLSIQGLNIRFRFDF